MTAFLHRFVAVAVSLVLAVPPESCSVIKQHDLAESAPVKATCCHQTTPHRPCDSGNVPTQPSVQCCCAQDAALPQKSVKPTDTLTLAFSAIANHLSPDLGSFWGETAITAIRCGPRLHVLQCVWRC